MFKCICLKKQSRKNTQKRNYGKNTGEKSKEIENKTIGL